MPATAPARVEEMNLMVEMVCVLVTIWGAKRRCEASSAGVDIAAEAVEESVGRVWPLTRRTTLRTSSSTIDTWACGVNFKI